MQKKKNANLIIIWVITIMLVAVTGLLVFFFLIYNKSLQSDYERKIYDKYYVMIADDPDSSLWQYVYKSASEAGEAVNAYVEMLSDRLSNKYDKYELMEIAKASNVDGIILAADESERMTELINDANRKGIPVVTVFSDNTQSERISFVGIGNYALGREYGNLLSDISGSGLDNKEVLKVAVLVDSNAKDSGQNVLYAAIQESVENDNKKYPYTHKPIKLSLFSVDSTNNFSIEESVRSLLQDKGSLPDVIVCLNEIDTTSVYQVVVDYNEVGEVAILGYYDSDAILKGIERNVIYSTISVNTKQLGQFSMDALTEYKELGNTSQYFTADISIINKGNVEAHMKDGDKNEE